jgi:hypothetical protein
MRRLRAASLLMGRLSIGVQISLICAAGFGTEGTRTLSSTNRVLCSHTGLGNEPGQRGRSSSFAGEGPEHVWNQPAGCRVATLKLEDAVRASTRRARGVTSRAARACVGLGGRLAATP